MNRLRNNLISFILSTCALSFLLVPCSNNTGMVMAEDSKAAFKTITPAEANEMLGKAGVIFLDVREPNEFQSGHAPGAVNIPLNSVESQIAKQVPDKATTLVVYCQGGRRSVTASQKLVNMGYKNILNMDGGWKAWLKAGFMVQQILEKSK